MVRKILSYSDSKEILTQVSIDADWEKDKDLIQDLKDTLLSTDGVGISAIQIGVPKKICYIRYAETNKILINPVITWKRKDTKEFEEGCLSVPNKFKNICRHQKVICEFTNENGEKEVLNKGGWLSAIIQHELDHFKGICEVYE